MPLPRRERARSISRRDPSGLFEVRVKFPLPLTPSRRVLSTRQGRENQYYMVAIVTIGIIRRLRRGDAATIKAVAS